MLNNTGIQFIEESHEYFLGDLKLRGISHLYGKHINPDKYSDVPESVLKKAAERGTRIHDECRQADLFGHAESTESKNYIELMQDNGFKVLESEYLVTDFQHFATAIDKVCTLNDKVCIGDIKTTYVLDEDSLKWQLSICAYLFELCNPTIKVEKLFGIWLRDDKKKIVEIDRLSNEVIIDLLDCEITGRPFSVPVIKVEGVDEALIKLSELESLILVAETELETKKKDVETIKAYLLEQMSKNKVKKWETDNITVTYVEPFERVSIDSKTLKVENPDIYQKYAKVSTIKESIKIKLK